MAGGGNNNPMTAGTAPVNTNPQSTWTAPPVGQLTVPPAPTVQAVPMVGGVNTGVPQGGYANPAIEAYIAGTNVPTLSYVPGQHDAWLGTVAQNAGMQADALARQSGGVESFAANNPKADGSHLTQKFYDQQVQTIRDETGWADYDPRVDTFAGSEYEDAYRNSAAAQEAADTLYSNAVGVGAGNSLESGQYSGVKLLDNVQSGVEHLGQFSPLLGGAATKGMDWARDTEGNVYRIDTPRSAMEIAIDRETNARAANVTPGSGTSKYTGRTIDTVTANDDDGTFMTHEEILAAHAKNGTTNKYQNANQGSGAKFASTPEQSAKKSGFDMNDPSTWSAPNDGGGNDDSSSKDSSDDGCVIATFAASTGVDIGKRDAVQWCMSTLHGNFIGETIRTGYQKLGRKKINAGKAVEHFEEFKRYIDYARGERKDLRAALTFYGRSMQFFVVGLLEK